MALTSDRGGALGSPQLHRQSATPLECVFAVMGVGAARATTAVLHRTRALQRSLQGGEHIPAQSSPPTRGTLPPGTRCLRRAGERCCSVYTGFHGGHGFGRGDGEAASAVEQRALRDSARDVHSAGATGRGCRR